MPIAHATYAACSGQHCEWRSGQGRPLRPSQSSPLCVPKQPPGSSSPTLALSLTDHFRSCAPGATIQSTHGASAEPASLSSSLVTDRPVCLLCIEAVLPFICGLTLRAIVDVLPTRSLTLLRFRCLLLARALLLLRSIPRCFGTGMCCPCDPIFTLLAVGAAVLRALGEAD